MTRIERGINSRGRLQVSCMLYVYLFSFIRTIREISGLFVRP